MLPLIFHRLKSLVFRRYSSRVLHVVLKIRAHSNLCASFVVNDVGKRMAGFVGAPLLIDYLY